MSSSKKSDKKPRPAKKKVVQAPDWFFDTRKWTILIFLLAFVLYGNTIFNGYTQDDDIVIRKNEFTKQGFGGFGKILTEDTFVGFFGVKKDLVSGGRYRPFSLLTFATEYAIFGENPGVSHFVNILLYALTGMVLFLLLKLLLVDRFPKDRFQVFWIAGVATLLFMVLPVHTEAVANIKGRDEIFSLLGSLAAFYFLLKGGTKNLIFSGLCFFGALLSKENAITFLAIIPVGMLLVQGRSIKDTFTPMIPVFAAAIGFILIRQAILGFGLGDPPAELMNNPYLKIEGNQYVPFTFSEKLSTITFTMGKYLQLLIAPLVLTHDYYPKHIDLMPWSDWRVLLSFVVYLVMIGFALLRFKQYPILAWSVLIYIASLSIVSNIVFPIGVHMSERFIYMPSVGFALAAAVLLYRLGLRGQTGKPVLSKMTLPIAIIGVFALLFTAKTIHRNMAWKNNYTLFTTDIKTSVNSAKLQNAVGGEIIEEARKLQNAAYQVLRPNASAAQLEPINQQFYADVREAIPHLQKALEIHPTFASPYLLLGNAHNYIQEYETAIQYYNQALVYKNPYQEATQNMGKTYLDGGKFFGEKQQNFQKALQWLTEAQKFENNDQLEIKRLKALCYASMNNLTQAIPLLEEVLQAQPTKSTAQNLANMYQGIGNLERAQQLRARAATMD